MLFLTTKNVGIYFVEDQCKNVSAMWQEWHLGDGSWHIIPVLCHIMYVCAFISQRSVIIYTALWFPPAFCGIKLVSGSYYRFMMQNRNTGFCWFITTDSVILDYRSRGGKDDQDQVSISDKTSYRKISWSLEAARFVFTIVRALWNLTETSAAVLKTHNIKKYRLTHEYSPKSKKKLCK